MRVSDRDLEQLAGRLGEAAAGRIDVERVAEEVTARLRTAGGSPGRGIGRWLAMAAGVALVAGAGWLTLARDVTPPALGPAPGLLPGLSDLSTTELHQVLDSLRPPAPARLGRATLDDLDAEQLEVLLAMMEG
jgi:hypothetical protein